MRVIREKWQGIQGHIMVFMLIKMMLAGIAGRTGYLADFDFERFYTDIDYCYLVKGSEAFKMVYLAAGIVLPLMLQRGLAVLRMRAGRLLHRLGRNVALFSRVSRKAASNALRV